MLKCIGCNPVPRGTRNHPHEELLNSCLPSVDSELQLDLGIALGVFIDSTKICQGYYLKALCQMPKTGCARKGAIKRINPPCDLATVQKGAIWIAPQFMPKPAAGYDTLESVCIAM
jgi:hypothetical protein